MASPALCLLDRLNRVSRVDRMIGTNPYVMAAWKYGHVRDKIAVIFRKTNLFLDIDPN